LAISDEKRELREMLKLRAAALPESYTRRADKQICGSVISTPEYKQAKTVFCFVGRPAEIDTRLILEDALRSGKRLCVPKCVSDGVMEARLITSLSDLSPAKHGLLEPDPSKSGLVFPQEIDFAVIPCVTCDHFGSRLGFGGGYYDRYLQGADFFKCMVCRSELISEKVPRESFDVIPDMLITEVLMLKM